MRIRDMHSTVEHEVSEGQRVQGYWRDHQGTSHPFSGVGFRAARGWAIGGWVFAYADPDSDWGVLNEGVVLVEPIGRKLVRDPVAQMSRVIEDAMGVEHLVRHAKTERRDV